MNPAVDVSLRQFEANALLVGQLLADVPEDRLRRRSQDGKWSALENLAHLGQFHEVIRERTGLMVDGENPTFARYVPEADPGTQGWMAKPSAQLFSDFNAERARLLAELRALPPAAWSRSGTHAAFGTLTLAQWLGFWLAHDGHHIMTAVVRART